MAKLTLTNSFITLFILAFIARKRKDTMPDTMFLQVLTWFESTLSGIQFRDPLPNRQRPGDRVLAWRRTWTNVPIPADG